MSIWQVFASTVYRVDVRRLHNRLQTHRSPFSVLRRPDISSALFAGAFSSVGWLHALENASVE